MGTERPPVEVKRYDLGHGVSWSKAVTSEGEWIGILKWHVCKDPDGRLTAGGVNFENAPDWVTGPRWHVIKEEPLTISPSVHCVTCGLHGFIQEGQWVPA